MDQELLWLVLLLLAFPFIAIMALVLSLHQRSRLQHLEARLDGTEAALFRLRQEYKALAEGRASPASSPLSAETPDETESAQPPPQTGKTEPETSVPDHALPVPPPLPLPFGRRKGADSAISFGGGETPLGTAPLAAAKAAFAKGFEEKIGARWSVWVGGLALALGGVFLVRFAVEENLLGPIGRVMLGLLLAAILLATGEVLRRADNRRVAEQPVTPEPEGEEATFPGPARSRRTLLPSIPATLTAAGTMTAFGSIYAAYELYALISPVTAFVLLALTGIATVFAALLHGPALAALGFVGAALTPFLIITNNPNAFGVAILISAVGASALVVARARYWRWLALLSIAGMGAWGFTLLLALVPQAVPATGLLGLVLLALTALLLSPGLFYGPPADGRRLDAISCLAATITLALGALAAVDDGTIPTSALAIFLLLGLGALVLSWRAPATSLVVPALAVMAPLLSAQWPLPPPPGTALAAPGPMAGVVAELPGPSLASFLLYSIGVGGVLFLAGLAGAWRKNRRMALVWAAAAAIGPVLMMIAAYARLTGLEESPPFALAGLVLALLFTFASEALTRHGRLAAAAIFAAGAVVNLALGLAFALEKGWLTVGLALAALGVAWVSTLRPLPGLRQLSAALGLVVLGRVMWMPSIAGDMLSTTPIFNWLLWGYGVPTLAFAAAARLLARKGDDWSRRVLESLSLVFAILLAALEAHHYAHGGTISVEEAGTGNQLFQSGLLSTLYGAYALGLIRLARISARPFFRLLASVVAALAAVLALGSLLWANPFATEQNVGGPIINDLLTGYALPALLALLIARELPENRPRLRLGVLASALVLGLAWLTFEISRLFQGPVLRVETISAMEWYAWSAAWLGVGIALLLAGLALRSRGLRLASAAVTGITVAKVFLSDMADLEGALRAFSFIGLGVVLVGMGWLYQRLLTSPTQTDADSPG
ncbi:DUF2339 domain-containing protein [Xanthobacter sp. TB0139]|uniref:DUF2339 domain-containing protein n=1 Tax=Xanthobacter sp. TB0139 TaxID=3459178 RepID=UPI004039EE21